MELGQRIYEHRTKVGMTQEQLAENMGVSRQAISKWESGAATPEVEKLKALAELFGVSVDELLGREKDKQQKEAQTAADVIAKKEQEWNRTGEELLERFSEVRKKVELLRKQSEKQEKSLQIWKSVFAVFAVVACIAFFILYGRMAMLSQENMNARSDIQSLTNLVYNLQDSNSSQPEWNQEIFSTWNWDIGELDIESGTIPLEVSCVPKTVNETSKLILTAFTEKNGIFSQEMEDINGVFRASLDLPWDILERLIVSVENDGERQVAILEEDLDFIEIFDIMPQMEVNLSGFKQENDRIKFDTEVYIELDNPDMMKNVAGMELWIQVGDPIVWRRELTEEEMQSLRQGDSVGITIQGDIEAPSGAEDICLYLAYHYAYTDTEWRLGGDISIGQDGLAGWTSAMSWWSPR